MEKCAKKIYNISMFQIMLFFTYLGNWQTIVGFSIVAIAILMLLRKKQEAFFFAITLISGEIIKELLKFIIQRPRPDASLALIQEGGYSFPSGHAMMSVVFYGMVGYFIYKLCRKKWQKIIISITTLIIIFLIGFSRIYLGVHWTSDVIAGWLIGFLVLGATWKILNNRVYFAKHT